MESRAVTIARNSASRLFNLDIGDNIMSAYSGWLGGPVVAPSPFIAPFLTSISQDKLAEPCIASFEMLSLYPQKQITLGTL
jgi:hypothetical protein